MSDTDGPRWIDDPPSDAAGWRQVWAEKRRYRGRLAPGIFSAVEALFERLLHPHVARQRDFNIVVSDLIRDLRTDLQALRRDFEQDRDALRREIQTGIPTVAARGDALIAALDQKIESLESKVRDVSTPLLREAPPTFRDDWSYRRFEEAMRGSSEEITADFLPLIPMAAARTPVLDLGCGRGEFLALCREQGIAASGLDSNERSVAELRSRGFDVRLGAVPDALDQWVDGSLGFVLSAHVVEHLPFSPLVGLFHQVRRILRPGGLWVIDTPNAGSMSVAAGDLWNDPTHVGPRTAAALVVMAREAGFSVASLETRRPFPESRKLPTDPDADPALTQLIDRLNGLLFGDQDLRLVLER